MNRKVALLAGIGAGSAAALAATGVSVSRRHAPQLESKKSRFPSLRRKNRQEKAITRSADGAGGTRWILGGGGGVLAAWAAAHRGPVAALAGLAGAAMLSRATVNRE